MKNNVNLAMSKPFDVNPFIKLWKMLTSSYIMKNMILEYIKFVKLAIVQVIGSFKSEHCSFVLTFMKTKLRN
jgi:hypothetical protein